MSTDLVSDLHHGYTELEPALLLHSNEALVLWAGAAGIVFVPFGSGVTSDPNRLLGVSRQRDRVVTPVRRADPRAGGATAR
jgi:hypothetical protein